MIFSMNLSLTVTDGDINDLSVTLNRPQKLKIRAVEDFQLP